MHGLENGPWQRGNCSVCPGEKQVSVVCMEFEGGLNGKLSGLLLLLETWGEGRPLDFGQTLCGPVL